MTPVFNKHKDFTRVENNFPLQF